MFLYISGAQKGAPGRSSIPIEIGEPIKPRKFGCHVRPSVRPSVRPYARIRAGDEFAVVCW